MTNTNFRAACLSCAAAFAISACASTNNEDVDVVGEPKWAANGWLTPGPTGEPEIIGLYLKRKDCEEAVRGWMSRQVVGNPIHGECLPIDNR